MIPGRRYRLPDGSMVRADRADHVPTAWVPLDHPVVADTAAAAELFGVQVGDSINARSEVPEHVDWWVTEMPSGVVRRLTADEVAALDET